MTIANIDDDYEKTIFIDIFGRPLKVGDFIMYDKRFGVIHEMDDISIEVKGKQNFFVNGFWQTQYPDYTSTNAILIDEVFVQMLTMERLSI